MHAVTQVCCEMHGGDRSTVEVKPSIYYHQVQLQLYVGVDLYARCDFLHFAQPKEWQLNEFRWI